MLEKDELYTNEIIVTKTNTLYSDENQVKILLIFTLLFMIITMGYLIYNSSDSESSIRGTRVLGVSYIPDEINQQEQIVKKHLVQYNSKSSTSTVDDEKEYEDVVMVDDKGDYRDATLVDNKKEFTHVVTVKNPI